MSAPLAAVDDRMRPSLFASRATGVSVSYEFFPPASDKMEAGLWRTVKTLEPLDPAFVSVTYGAGGSTRERTHNLVARLLAETKLKPAAHLTCVAASRGEIDEVVQRYWELGVRHIVALRGDAPEGEDRYRPHPQGYTNAADLVGGVRAVGDFEVSVAAYPERHPDSPSWEAELDNLAAKVDAGATRAITQFFFESEAFFRLQDRCAARGIFIPIVPGILPVTNFKMLKGFAARCGASVPEWLGALFQDLDDRPETRNLVAATVAGEMCRRLYAGGVRDFHFYTLNRAALSFAISHMLGHTLGGLPAALPPA